ncbi:MAG TPA: class I SAM-dependent methyltransferase [Bacteroidota bacterium]|nr:class I SAM-dependent methyltransferase [Bacteroidota bacterium]
MNRAIRNFIRDQGIRQKFYRSLSDNARVLDLGCGAGENGRILKELHPAIELHGVDIRPVAGIPEFYKYRQVDIDKSELPFPDAYFDAIIFTHVIEHLHSPLALGNDIYRVMSKDAQIFVETPNWTSIFVPSFAFHRTQHNPFNFYDDPSHVKPWSKHGLFEFLIQSCHLRVLEVGVVRNWIRLPVDLALIFWALLCGDRGRVIESFWNLYGWCIFGIGVKD